MVRILETKIAILLFFWHPQHPAVVLYIHWTLSTRIVGTMTVLLVLCPCHLGKVLINLNICWMDMHVEFTLYLCLVFLLMLSSLVTFILS